MSPAPESAPTKPDRPVKTAICLKWHYSPMPGRTKVLRAAAAISCTFLLANCSADTTPTGAAPVQSITASPTASEPTALEVFAELRDRADKIYAERDFKAMKGVYSHGGPTWKRVMADLKAMRKADVVLKSLDEIIGRTVLTESSTRIVIREILVSDGRFIHSSGDDFTGDREPQRQIVRWVLVRNGDHFLIHDSVIQSTRDASK